MGQRAPRKSRQIATLRPPLSRIPSGDNDQVANRCSGVLGRTHLPRRSDARCPAGRPLSRPAASDWRAPRPIAGSARWRRSRTFSKKPAIAGHVRGDRPATTISRRRTPKRNPAATTRSGPSIASSARLRFELPGLFAKRGVMLGQPPDGWFRIVAVDATQPVKRGVLFSPFLAIRSHLTDN